MKTKKKLSSDELKKRWLSWFEQLVTKERPEFSGKIDWNSAYHFMHQGLTTKEACDKYLEARKGE